MDKAQLEQQADQIEAALRGIGSYCRVTGGNVTPQWVQFIAVPSPHVPLSRFVDSAPLIAEALGVAQVNLSANRGRLQIDVQRGDPQPVSLARLMARIPNNRMPALTAVLGLEINGAPLLVNLRGEDSAHVASDTIEPLETLITSLLFWHTAKSLHVITSLPLALPLTSAALVDKWREMFTRTADTFGKAIHILETRITHSLPHVIVIVDEAALQMTDPGRLSAARDISPAYGVHFFGLTHSREWPIVITRRASRTYTAQHRREITVFDRAVPDLA